MRDPDFINRYYAYTQRLKVQQDEVFLADASPAPYAKQESIELQIEMLRVFVDQYCYINLADFAQDHLDGSTRGNTNHPPYVMAWTNFAGQLGLRPMTTRPL